MLDFVTRCKTCRHPLAPQINEWLKAGMGTWEVAKRLKAVNMPVTQPAILAHRKKHLSTEVVVAKQEAMRAMQQQQRTMPPPPEKDFLTAVRDNVHARIQSGELSPGVRDGIDAQKALDARLDRGADRELAVKLALILGGAARPQITEGEYRELDPEEAEDFEAVRLLASGA